MFWKSGQIHYEVITDCATMTIYQRTTGDIFIHTCIAAPPATHHIFFCLGIYDQDIELSLYFKFISTITLLKSILNVNWNDQIFYLYCIRRLTKIIMCLITVTYFGNFLEYENLRTGYNITSQIYRNRNIVADVTPSLLVDDWIIRHT